MKLSARRNLTVALLTIIPLPLFLVARETASWRPQKIIEFNSLGSDGPFVGTLAISPDERFVAKASSDESGLVTVRDLQSGKEVRRGAFAHVVTRLCFSSDARSLAIGWRQISPSGTSFKRLGVSVWNFDKQPRDFETIEANISFDAPQQLRFSPDGKILWMASTDNLRAWEVASGRLKWQWRKGDFGCDSSLPFFTALSKDCRLYFRSDSNGYNVWDVNSRKRLLHTNLAFLADSDLQFSSDSSLATYFADTPNGSFNPVIDTRTGQKLWQADEKSGVILFSDKAVVASKSKLEIRNPRTGKLWYQLPALPHASVTWSESRDWLYILSDNNQLFHQRLR